MAGSTQRSPSARSKSSSNAKGGSKSSGSKRSGSSSSRSAAASNRSPGSRTTSGSSRAKSSGSRSGGSRSSASKNSRSSSSGGPRNASSSGSDGVVHNVTETVGSAANKAKAPLVAGGAAAAGLIGGLVLGSRVLLPRKKLLGVPISRRGLDFKPVAKEVHKAGEQLGRLTDEMAQARKQAKKVSDALS